MTVVGLLAWCLLIAVLFIIIMARIERYKKFKDFRARIMVATNIFGRGIDIERVNVVFNYDMPEDPDTYLHRVRLASSLFDANVFLSGGKSWKIRNKGFGHLLCCLGSRW